MSPPASLVLDAGVPGGRAPVTHMSASKQWNWFVLGGMIVVLAAGLVNAPHRSDDLYAYGAYGRMVSEHHVSPYATRPSAFSDDPVIARMAPAWRNTRSVYGPVFTAISAAGMKAVGTSRLGERLYFQALTAVVTAGSALLLKRMSPSNWWIYALNPVTLVVVAHEGHNDAFVGLGVLSALWFARRAQLRREKPALFLHLAFGSMVFAASIKITAILAIPIFAMWILSRFGWRTLARIAAPWAVVCGLLFTLTGGSSAFTAFRGLRKIRSTTSLWHLDFIRHFTDSADGKPGFAALALPAIVLLIVGAIVVLRVWQSSEVHPDDLLSVQQKTDHLHTNYLDAEHRSEYAQLAGFLLIPLIVFITLGLYILPWYWGWLLAPAILLESRFRNTVLLAAALHSVAYGAGTLLRGTPADLLRFGRFGAPVALVVVFVAALAHLRSGKSERARFLSSAGQQ